MDEADGIVLKIVVDPISTPLLYKDLAAVPKGRKRAALIKRIAETYLTERASGSSSTIANRERAFALEPEIPTKANPPKLEATEPNLASLVSGVDDYLATFVNSAPRPPLA
jgi:hypothetical protein